MVKLTSDGKHIWSSFVPGPAMGVACDSKDNICVTGDTMTKDWAKGGYDTTLGNRDAYLLKLAPAGSMVWSTYLGSDTGIEYVYDVAVNGLDEIFVPGFTSKSGWIYGGFNASRLDATGWTFIAKLAADGRHLWSDNLGMNSDTMGLAVCDGMMYLVGDTYSSGWLTGGYDTSYNGGQDAFALKMLDGIVTPGGTLNIKIAPADVVTKGAHWRLAGASIWRASDTGLPALAPGDYQIEFSDVVNWNTPSPQIVTVKATQSTELQVTYQATLSVTPLSPPVQAVKAGQPVILSLSATGLTPISYQWKKDGNPISGAQASSLSLNPCQIMDDGRYTCVVRNPSVSLEAGPFQLVINNGSSVISYLLGLTNDPAGLDLNGDKVVNIADALKGVQSTPPATPAYLAPANGAKWVDRPPLLDWTDGAYTLTYDLYLWPASTSAPVTPTAGGLTSSQWSPASKLACFTQYNWKVVARNASQSVNGPTWSFTTEKAVHLEAPNGGEIWTRGKAATIGWKADPAVAGTTIRLELWQNGKRVMVLKDASTSASGARSETIIVPSNLTPASNYLVMAVSIKLEQAKAGAAAYDESDKVLMVQ